MSILFRRERIPTEDAPSPPKSGIQRVWFLLKTNFWKLVSLNLLMLAFCLPIVTIPAAIAAGDRVCLLLWREGNCFLWQDFWEEFKADVLRALPIGICALAGAAMVLFGGSIVSGAMNAATLVPRALLLSGGLWISAAASYAFAMLALVRLPVGQILKNAALLTMLEPKRTLLTLLLGGGTLLLGGFFLPYTVPLWLFLLLALWRFFCCSLTYAPILRRVLPKEETDGD